jgi:hypothetical protein
MEQLNNEGQSAPRTWKRRKLIIFPAFQYILLGTNISVTVVISALVWILMRRTFSDLSVVGGLSGREVEHYKRYLAYQAAQFETSMLIAFAVCLAVSVVVTLIVSHRFAGPMVRLRGFFRGIIERPDPLPKLGFREGDFLSEYPPLINEALQVLKASAESGGESGVEELPRKNRR